MIPLRLVRTTIFRLTLVYMALFGASSLALLAFVYVTTAGFIARQTDQTILTEIAGLAETYRARGLNGLVRVVAERSASDRYPESIYLLRDQNGSRIAGNLKRWPTAAPSSEGWLDFRVDALRSPGEEPHWARGRVYALSGGFLLLVARDVNAAWRLDRLLKESIVWAVVLVLVLGTAGGVFMARNLLRRLDQMSRTADDIMTGDLSHRVPVTGTGDEFDRLATSLNAMLDRIEQLMAGVREVSNNIAHDLRTPLNRLRSRLEMTLLEDGDADSHRAVMEQTIAEADTLLATFNALLHIAEAETGSGRLAQETLDLSALVSDVVELYQPAAEEAELTMSSAITPGVGARGNRHLLSQALANLLDNAIKYTPPGGTVRVDLTDAADGPEIMVADSGPGIPAAERDRVLERFVRLEHSRSRPGSGLGLSLVRAVARLHGATLHLEDGSPGLRVALTLRQRAGGGSALPPRKQGRDMAIEEAAPERRTEEGAGSGP